MTNEEPFTLQRWYELNRLPLTKCDHYDQRKWVEGRHENGRVVTTCRVCGGFVGRRTLK